LTLNVLRSKMISTLNIAAMVKIDFTPVFEYIDKQTALLREELPSKEDYFQLQAAVDGLAKRMDDHHAEILSLTHRSDRIESWVKKAAPKVEIPFET